MVKPGKLNVGPNHLSRLDSVESGGALYDQLPDADLFKVEAIPDYISYIALFLRFFPRKEFCNSEEAYGDQSSRLSIDCRSFIKAWDF